MNVKNIKKGFTLTELIIVIVIIGILAGVLIPTFINVVNKANKAADLSLIRNLNEALTLDRYDNGEHKNMTQALKAADDYGFAVDKIDAKVSKNKILWDSENDVFCYLVGDDTLEYYPNSVSKEIHLDDPEEVYLLWIIDNKVNSKFSTYLFGYTDTTDEEHPLIANGVGLDTGKCDVAFVKYVNNSGKAKDIIIRTDSTETALTIDGYVNPLNKADGDTIKHYDKVGTLNIIAVANASYHENGSVQFVEISTGRIALEVGAEVTHIHINKKENAGENENAFADIIISYDKSVDLTDVGFSRDDVEIAANGTLVVALQAGTEEVTEQTELDYVWLTKQGVYEQIVVSDNNISTISEGKAEVEWVDTSDKSDETKDAAYKIANNIDRDEYGQVNSTVEIDNKTYSVDFDEDRNMTFTNESTNTSDPVISGNTTTTTSTTSVTVYTVTDSGMVSTTTTTTTTTTQEGSNAPTVEESTQINQTEYVTVGTTTTVTNYTIDAEGNKSQNGDSAVATASDTALVTAVNTGADNSAEKPADKEDAKAGATLFAGGSGTKNDPFLIYDYATMQKISDFYSSGYYYFKVAIEKTNNGTIDCAGWTGVDMKGSFDGNGVVFKNLDAPLFNKVNSNIPSGVVLKNFSVDNCFIMTGSYYVAAVLRVAYHDVTMEDVNISGYLEANSPGSFIGQGNFYDTDCNISFIRCHSSMNLVSLNAQCGGFTGNLFGNYYNKNHQCLVNLVDSYFDGSLAVASGSRYSYVECHTATPIKYSISYTNEALENQCSSLYSTGHTEAKDVAYLGSTKTLTKGTFSLPETGSVFSISKTTGATRAKVYLIVGLNPGNFTTIFVSEEIDLSGVTDSFSTDIVKNYNVVVNDGTHNKTEIIGDTLYIYDDRYESGYGSLTFMVVQYESLGGIVSVATKSK